MMMWAHWTVQVSLPSKTSSTHEVHLSADERRIYDRLYRESRCVICMYVCMYVCPKIYIRRALSEKSQSRRGLKQTETSSVPVWTVQWTSRLSAERTGDCSRSWLQRQRNSDHGMYCWCVEQRTSQYPTIEACVDRSPRWADSRQHGGSWPSSDCALMCCTVHQWSCFLSRSHLYCLMTVVHMYV